MVKKFLIVPKKPTTNATKTASKRAIQKTAEAAADLTGNKIADKIKSVSKNSYKDLHSKELQNNEANDEIEIPKERYISPEKKTINY